MGHGRFEGFSAGLFQFLRGLAENNNKAWFEERRRVYETEVLGPIKAFVDDLGLVLRTLNEEFETEPRVGRTISRISNDLRFHKNRPPYRPFIYMSFARRGKRLATEAQLYVALNGQAASVGFYPGGAREPQSGPIQEGISENLRFFQRYLDERRIPEKYWELAEANTGAVTRWPLPKSARRWVNLEGFTVGENFPAAECVLARRAFLDSAQQILVDLYPLWLFSTSENLKEDLELYDDNARLLARPLSRSAGGRRYAVGSK